MLFGEHARDSDAILVACDRDVDEGELRGAVALEKEGVARGLSGHELGGDGPGAGAAASLGSACPGAASPVGSLGAGVEFPQAGPRHRAMRANPTLLIGLRSPPRETGPDGTITGGEVAGLRTPSQSRA